MSGDCWSNDGLLDPQRRRNKQEDISDDKTVFVQTMRSTVISACEKHLSKCCVAKLYWYKERGVLSTGRLKGIMGG